MATKCYEEMFCLCTALTTAPALPATTLAESCYSYMFNGCTALETAPVLSVEKLAESCYMGMFNECKALTTAPELPATTLTESCYSCMFYGCAALETAPELPATTLAAECYKSMFVECTALQAPAMMDRVTALANSCCAAMYFGCTSLNIYTSAQEGYTNEWKATKATEVSGWADDMFAYANPGTGGSAQKLVVTAGNTYYIKGAAVTFTAQKNNSSVTFNYSNGSNVQYRMNGGEWQNYSEGTAISLGEGDAVSFKGTNVKTNASEHFSMSGKIVASGDVTSLTNGLGGDVALTESCYSSMFSGCTALTTAPELPSTKLAAGCYQNMFSGCTSLEAPSMMDHVTTLADSCCSSMYSGCTSLYIYTTAQEGCTRKWKATSDTSASEVSGWATDMFKDCGALVDVTAGTTYYIHDAADGGPLTFTALEDNSEVTFKYLDGTDVQYRVNNGEWQNCNNPQDVNGDIISLNKDEKVSFKGTDCKTGWDEDGENCYGFSITEGNVAASGDVTSLTNGIGGDVALTESCYAYMFYECSALTTAPNLPSTTLAGGCYECMFADCTALTTAPELPATLLTTSCYANMFEGCILLTTAPELPAKTLAESCYSCMFYKCSKLKTAPELPATELAKYCYLDMFNGCVTLEAPAMMDEVKTLDESCCGEDSGGMYMGCTSLKIYTEPQKGYAKEWKATKATEVSGWATNMFDGCGASVDVTAGTTYYIKGEAAHTHSWTYTLSIDKKTITAQCGTSGCTAQDITLTINAPTSTAYDGTDKKANFGDATTFLGETTLPTISYEYKAESSGTYATATDLTKAGYYKASFTVGEGTGAKTGYVEYTIGKATLEKDNFTYSDPDNLTYNGEAKEATVNAASGMTGVGTISIKYYSDEECKTEATPTDAGTYYVGITVAEGDNYEAVTDVIKNSNWKFEIKRATAKVSDFDFTAPDNLTYDKSEKSATVTAKDGLNGLGAITVKYSSDGGSTWTATPTNAGTYKVGIELAEGTNYSATTDDVLTNSEWTFNITQRQITVTPDSGKTAQYNNADPVFTYSSDGAVSGETAAFEGALSRESGSNVTETGYQITLGTLELKDNGSFKASNYELKLSDTPVYFKIVKSKVDVPVANSGLVYDGKKKVGVRSLFGAPYSLSGHTATNAGDYTAVVKLKDTTNYEWNLETPTTDDQEISWKIAKKPLEISGTYTDSKAYDGTTDIDASAIHPGNLSGVETGDGTITVSATGVYKSKDAGTPYVEITYSISGDKAGNYLAPVKEEVAGTIDQRTVTLYSESGSKDYDGQPLTKPIVYKNSDKDDIDSVFASEVSELTATGTVTNVSEGTVYNTISYTYKQDCSENNYDISKTEGQLSITQAGGMTITGTSYDGVYDGDKHGVAAVPSIESGTTVKYSVDGGEYSETVPQIENVGTINVKAKAENANYKDATCDYTLIVTAASVNVPVAISGLVYNGKEQTGVILPEDAKYTLEKNTATDADTYKAVAKLNDTKNYQWNIATPTSNDQTIDWTIAGKPVTVTAIDKSMTLGGTVPKFTADVEGLLGTDTVSYTFNELKPTAQGVYSIVPTGNATQGNYSVTCVQGKLTVTKPDSNAVANPEDVSKVLDNYREKDDYKNKTLDVEVKTDGEVPQSDKNLITKTVGSAKKIIFTDTDLYLIIKENGVKTDEKDIGDENDTLIAVTYKFDFSKKENIQVFRVHNEAVDELTTTPNANGEYATFDEKAGTITVCAKKYSTYAFAYDEVKEATTGTSDKSDGAGTGDTNNLMLYFGLFDLVMIAVVAMLYARTRKNR